MGPLSRLPAFFALEGKRAVVAGGGEPPRRGKPNCSRPPAPASRFSHRRRARRCSRLPPRRRAAPIAMHRTPLGGGRFRRRRNRRCRLRRRRGGRAIRRGGARGRRAGQCHRPSGVLRFFVRRHRQSLAARHRHFDRRRRAGVRPGDPRQDRSADPERFCPLGRRRPRLAAARAGARRCRFAAAAASGKDSPRARSPRPIAAPTRGRSRRAADAGGGATDAARSFLSAPAPAIRNC